MIIKCACGLDVDCWEDQDSCCPQCGKLLFRAYRWYLDAGTWIIGTVIAAAIFLAANLSKDAWGEIGNVSGGLIILGLAAFIYFIPSVVAHSQNRRQRGAIFMLNLLAGWTVLGWIAAMVWACVEDRNP